MSLVQPLRRVFIALSLVLLLTITACGGSTVATNRTSDQPTVADNRSVNQTERGNTGAGQEFGNWVVQTSRGLVQDAYVRDNDKLGVVISPQVRPNDVRPLAKSLVDGFRRNVPNRDLTVLMYAPDKQLILTARYDDSSKQIQYQ